MLCGSDANHPQEITCDLTGLHDCPICTLNLHTYPIAEHERCFTMYCMNCAATWELLK